MVNQKAKEVEVPNNSSTEAELIAATVGVPEVLNSTIHLANHDPGWSLIFAELEQKIHDVLGDQVLLLEHIGSTSVSGLAAKPIIDMVLAVSDSSNESCYIPQLEMLGYTLKIREPNWYEHILLDKEIKKSGRD